MPVELLQPVLKAGRPDLAKHGQKLKYEANLTKAHLLQNLGLGGEFEEGVKGDVEVAGTIMLLGKAETTFKLHMKWLAHWQAYAVAGHINPLMPLPLHVCAFVGHVASLHGPNQAIKALGVVRSHILEKQAVLKQNSWHISCLVDGLNNLAACRQKPVVAVLWDTLNDILAVTVAHVPIALFTKRNVAYVYMLFVSGARPGEVIPVVWEGLEILSKELEPICTLNPWDQATVAKLCVAAYVLQVKCWIKTDALRQHSFLIPCGSLPTRALFTYARALIEFPHLKAANRMYVFPVLGGPKVGHISYQSMEDWWNEARAQAYMHNACSREVREWGTLYSLKRGFTSALHSNSVPVHVALSCTRHKTLSAHFRYPVATGQQRLDAIAKSI